MITSKQNGLVVPDIEEIALDHRLLREILRRRMRVWAVLSAAVFLGLLLGGLFIWPQTFVSTVSISLQQPPGGLGSNTTLQLLTGMGVGDKRYLGVLKSRKLATEVEHTAHLRELYHLPAEQDAIEKIQQSIRVEDNVLDGLLYIDVTLDGPPRLAPGAVARREQVKGTTAKIANAYAEALRHYLLHDNSDQGVVMLQEAHGHIREARDNYEAAVSRLAAFVRDAPTEVGGAQNIAAPVAATQLQALYLKRGQIEEQMTSADAERAATNALLTAKPGALPSEDPLLTNARREVADAQTTLQNLQVQYGDWNPRVVAAQKRLKIAQDHLQTQEQSIRQGLTSQDAKRKALQAEYDTVNRQVAQAEESFQLSRVEGAELERRRNEVTLCLEALKTTVSQAAQLSLQTASIRSRMAVVDEAIPPRSGKPGLLVMGVLSLAGAAACIAAWLIGEYILRLIEPPRYPAIAAAPWNERIEN